MLDFAQSRFYSHNFWLHMNNHFQTDGDLFGKTRCTQSTRNQTVLTTREYVSSTQCSFSNSSRPFAFLHAFRCLKWYTLFTWIDCPPTGWMEYSCSECMYVVTHELEGKDPWFDEWTIPVPIRRVRLVCVFICFGRMQAEPTVMVHFLALLLVESVVDRKDCRQTQSLVLGRQVH